MSTPSPRSRPQIRHLLLPALIGLAAGCSDPELTTNDVQEAAKERVRQELGLKPDATLFTQVFTGREHEGEPVYCGTVSGQRADGSDVPPRRFVVGSEESRFLAIDPAQAAVYETANEPFADWAKLCAGASGT